MASIEKIKELFEAAQFMPKLEEVIEVRISIEESALAQKSEEEGAILAEVKRRLGTLYIRELLALVQQYMQNRLSDEQIGELITFYRSPLYVMFNAMVPDFLEIMQSSLGNIAAFTEKHAFSIAEQVAQEFRTGRLTSSLQ